MKIRQTAAAVLLAAGLAVVPAAAQGPGRGPMGHGGPVGHDGPMGHGGHRGGMMLHGLDLTEAQKERVKQIHEDARSQSKPVAEQMKQVREELHEAVKANNTGVIGTLAARQGQLTGQMTEIHARAMAAVHAQLTPEQKQKLADREAKMRERMQERMQNMRERAKERGGARQNR